MNAVAVVALELGYLAWAKQHEYADTYSEWIGVHALPGVRCAWLPHVANDQVSVMPLPRMTTRRWMIAVAVVGLLITGAIHVERRRDRFKSLAECYGIWLAAFPQFFEKGSPRVEWHEALYLKYKFAARNPFLPVWSDLPEPKWELQVQPQTASETIPPAPGAPIENGVTLDSNKDGPDDAARRPWLPVPPVPPEPK